MHRNACSYMIVNIETPLLLGITPPRQARIQVNNIPILYIAARRMAEPTCSHAIRVCERPNQPIQISCNHSITAPLPLSLHSHSINLIYSQLHKRPCQSSSPPPLEQYRSRIYPLAAPVSYMHSGSMELLGIWFAPWMNRQLTSTNPPTCPWIGAQLSMR